MSQRWIRNKFQSRPLTARSGSSLVELLVVLLILVVLATLVNSRLGGRGKTAQELCRRNLQEIYLTFTIYANDNRGAFPFWQGAARSAEALSLLAPRSTTETAMFICPGSGDKPLPEGESFAGRRISYAYYMGRSTNHSGGEALLSDWQVNGLPKRKGEALFSADGRKPGNNHGKDGGNILLGNGEVATSGPKAARDLPVPAGITLLNP